MLSNKEKCLNFAGDSTLHGVSHIANTKSGLFKRLCWFLFFSAMVATFIYFISEQCIKYLSYPKSTRVDIKEQRPIKFPSVTICNQNLFRKTVMANTIPLASELVKLAYPTVIAPTVNITDILGNPQIVAQLDSINLTKLQADNIQPVNEMFQECKFRGSKINCEETFKPIITAFGFCYIFNSYQDVLSNGSYETYGTGSAQGLHLRMNVNQSEYFFGPSMSAGFKVVLHDPYVFPDIGSKAFVVKPGFESFVSVKLLKTESLPKPYEDWHCEEHRGKTLKYFKTYSQTECYSECMADYMVKTCGCLFSMVVPAIHLACNVTASLRCAREAEVLFFLEGHYQKCQCLEKCEMEHYRVSVSQAAFPSQPILDDILRHNNLSEKDIRENYLELRIYFEELNYNYIREYPSYTIGHFWSDVGGQLGLCLGASIITVLEFLDFSGALMFRNKRKKTP